MDHKYKVSVIVPVYNVEKYLSECLDSLVRQCFEGLQIVLVNDGSIDSSAQIAESYEKKYPFVTLVNRSNGGLSAARNSGLKIAKGEYVFFVDSDDIIANTSIADLYNICRENDLDVLRFNYSINIDENGNDMNINVTPIKEEGILQGIHFLYQVELDPSSCLMFIRRELLVLNSIFFLEGVIHEDHLFFVELMLVSNRVLFKNIPVYKRRIRRGSITQTNDGYNRWRSYLLMAEELRLFASQKELESDSINELMTHFLKWTYNYLRYAGCTKESNSLILLQKDLVNEYSLGLGTKRRLIMKYPVVARQYVRWLGQ